MFAVFKTGGKQYKVSTGDIFSVEKLSAEEGDKIRFNQVLAMGDKSQTIGDPLVSGACVEAEILSQTKGEKTINFVKRRRKHSSQRKKGHRQNLTVIKVLDIKSNQKSSVKISANYEIIGKLVTEKKSGKLSGQDSPPAQPVKSLTTTAPSSTKTSKKNPAVAKSTEPKTNSTKGNVKESKSTKSEAKKATIKKSSGQTRNKS